MTDLSGFKIACSFSSNSEQQDAGNVNSQKNAEVADYYNFYDHPITHEAPKPPKVKSKQKSAKPPVRKGAPSKPVPVHTPPSRKTAPKVAFVG